MSHAPSPCSTSVDAIPGEPDEMEIGDEEDSNRQDIICDDPPPSHETSAGIPGPDSALSYPTPNSNPRDTPTLANKKARKLIEAPPNSVAGKESLPLSPSLSRCLDNNLIDQISDNEDASQMETDSSNARKRKQAHTSLEGYDNLSNRTARLSSEGSSNNGQQTSSFNASLSADEEDLEAQSFLSLPDSGSGSLNDECTTEAGDGNDIHCPNSLESILSKITPKEVAQVRSTGDQLLLCDLGSFLERHSQTWAVSGFWNAPSWNISGSSRIISRSNRAGLMNYLEGLKQEDETHCLKLCAARVELFLFFVREVEHERRRGTAESVLKKNATSNLCNTVGMTPAETKKLRKSFYNNKQLGEYMWWCMCFFGPSFLLRCSKEARKKMLVSGFSAQLQADRYTETIRIFNWTP